MSIARHPRKQRHMTERVFLRIHDECWCNGRNRRRRGATGPVGQALGGNQAWTCLHKRPLPAHRRQHFAGQRRLSPPDIQAQPWHKSPVTLFSDVGLTRSFDNRPRLRLETYR